jgi:hypothetical protein
MVQRQPEPQLLHLSAEELPGRKSRLQSVQFSSDFAPIGRLMIAEDH